MSQETPSTLSVEKRKKAPGPTQASCQECRRSKLKCDKVFPCESCRKRGCAEICPKGSLGPVKKQSKPRDTRVEQLEALVKSLKAEVQELKTKGSESASEAPGTSPSQHPLLRVTSIQPTQATESFEEKLKEAEVGLGKLTISREGQLQYDGDPSASDVFDFLLRKEGPNDRMPPERYLSLSPEVLELLHSYPFGQREPVYASYLFTTYLPSRIRALELTDIYYEMQSWLFNPIRREDFMPVLNTIYGEDGSILVGQLQPGQAHKLTVLFCILAFGVRMDKSIPYPEAASWHYHALAKASFSLDSFPRTVGYFTTLSLLFFAQHICASDRALSQERWFTSGLAAQSAQLIGLQRSRVGMQANYDAAETQRRRRLFFDLFTYDQWQALFGGRPPALWVQHTDCPFPESDGPVMDFHGYVWRYSTQCISPTLEILFSAVPARYSALLERERFVRQYPVPDYLTAPLPPFDDGRTWAADPRHAMQQYLIVCLKEAMLLYMHRAYFAAALVQSPPEDPLTHVYTPSLISVYVSACRLIAGLKGLLSAHDIPARGAWFFWTYFFSSTIVLGALVIERPKCPFALQALNVLRTAVPLFEEKATEAAAPASRRLLEKMLKRAEAVLSQDALDNVNSDAIHSTTFDPIDVAFLRTPSAAPATHVNSPLASTTLFTTPPSTQPPLFSFNSDTQVLTTSLSSFEEVDMQEPPVQSAYFDPSLFPIMQDLYVTSTGGTSSAESSMLEMGELWMDDPGISFWKDFQHAFE